MSVTQSSKLASGFFSYSFFGGEGRRRRGRLSVISRQKKPSYVVVFVVYPYHGDWHPMIISFFRFFCGLSKSTSSGCFESPLVALAYSSNRLCVMCRSNTNTHSFSVKKNREDTLQKKNQQAPDNAGRILS